jgi:adenylate cyclase
LKTENSENQIADELIQSEYVRIKLFISALLVSLLAMSFLMFGPPSIFNFFSHERTKYLIVLWIAAFALYEFCMMLIIRRLIKQNKGQPFTLKLCNIVVEILFPTVLFFFISYIEKTPHFIDSPLFLFYFILIVLSALHLNTKLALLTSFLSALSYFMVTTWAIYTYDPEFEILYFPPLLYQMRSVFIFLGGLCTVFVTNEIKKRITHIGHLSDQKSKIENLFGQQVSPQVAQALLERDQNGTKLSASILFLDVRDFSDYAEHKTPEEVNVFQNDIFCPFIDIINRNNGIVNQILGDGFMATFGAPVKDNDHSKKAFKAGTEILEELDLLIKQKIIPPTKVGIGLHTGNVLVGNIGNEIRKQYSVSGTTVIVAARLEQLNKELNTTFLISEDMYSQVNHLDYHFVPFKDLSIKGTNHPISVYEVTK